MTSRGFTLIELLVTMGIMTLISAMVFFNFPKLNQQVLMNRAAREFASAIREAQTQAVAVAQLPGAGPNQFPRNYGIHIRKGDSFWLFSDGYDSSLPTADFPDPYQTKIRKAPVDYEDKKINETGSGVTAGSCAGFPECIKPYRFLKGITISNITFPSPDGRNCANGTLIQGCKMSFIFYRPEPTTQAIYSGTCEGGCPGKPYGPFTIELSSSSDSSIKKYIKIYTTGQVSISATP